MEAAVFCMAVVVRELTGVLGIALITICVLVSTAATSAALVIVTTVVALVGVVATIGMLVVVLE